MDLEVRQQLAEGDRPTLARLYAHTWFGDDRAGPELDRMLGETDAIVALYDAESLVAFGHAITDGAFVAYLRDLVVADGYRGQGVGHRLVDELLAHPELGDVATISLTCPAELAPFYESCGFAEREGAVVMNRPSEPTDG